LARKALRLPYAQLDDCTASAGGLIDLLCAGGAVRQYRREFKQYGLPAWLRDLVGILKLTFLLMLLIGLERGPFAVAGGLGIAGLMGALCSLICD